MIGVSEATSLLYENPISVATKLVGIIESRNRILAHDILADRDLPPFDRIMMDGIAIRYESFARGNRKFPIEKIVPAGTTKVHIENPNCALEVMTGAVLPDGVDTVIRYEDLEKRNGVARVKIDDVVRGANIHYQGSDHKKGKVLVKAPVRITPAEIGVAATVGMEEIPVYQMPAVLLVSTGDELVQISEKPKSHQIRMSNNYVLEAVLSDLQCPVFYEHLKDDETVTRTSIEKWMNQFQVIIFIGGSSMGKYDYVPRVLEQLGFNTIFYKVKQRPGKPVWFGDYNKKVFVFALPGNPVSSFLCSLRYVTPWFLNSAGIRLESLYGTLASDVSFMPDLTYFLQVDAQYNNLDGYLAHPKPGHGSGDLVNLVEANAFMELPQDRDHFRKGERYPLYFYRD